MCRHGAPLLLLASVALASTVSAQSNRAQPREPIGAIVGGVLGAGIGLTAGALMGYEMACSSGCPGDFAGYGAALTGALVGEALFLPLGTHLGNGTAGNLALDVGVSVGMAAGAILLTASAESSGMLTLGALAQIGMTVWSERSSARRKGPEVQVQTRGFSNGRLGVGLEIRY